MPNGHYTQLCALLLALLLTSTVSAQSRTGTHLPIGTQSGPSNTLLVNPDGDLNLIRQLMEGGQKQKALAIAKINLADIENSNQKFEGSRHYDALNALCVAHTGLGQLPEAMTACSRAMGLRTDLWTAANNRGTAHLLAGDFDAAMADYELAMRRVPKRNQAARDTIRFNMSLVEARRKSVD
jgi:tetratricopeptide (TPR) repeat protein